MSFFNWFFPHAPPVPPPGPVDPAYFQTMRDKVAAGIADCHRREEERRRQWEEELQRQREEERRREEEEAAAGIAPKGHCILAQRGGPFVDEFRKAFGNGCFGDAPGFSRILLQAVRSVYGDNPVPFYKAAGLSRSTYSKLISHPKRHPSKDTVLAMAAALKMDVPAAENFLQLAGYAFSDIIPSDVVWKTCFAHGVHNLPQIRELLAEFDPPE